MSFCLCRNLALSILSFEINKIENVYSFTAAERGFHYCRKFWKPKENETLDCFHEEHITRSIGLQSRKSQVMG